MRFDHTEYPLDTTNPANPPWLAITGRWVREPKSWASYSGDVKGSGRHRTGRKFSIMDEAGVIVKCNSLSQGGRLVGYGASAHSLMSRCIQKKDEDGYFYAKGKRYKFIE